MATGQSIRDRLKRVQGNPDSKPGVLPLIAYYGREPKAEIARNTMYREIEVVMNGEDTRDITYFAWARGIAMVDANSSPIEYLVAKGQMESKKDADGVSGARYHTALKIRTLIDGAQVKVIRSPSLEGVGGGAPSSSGDIRGYQLDCMKLVETLKKSLDRWWLWFILESVVWGDEWLDIRATKGGAKAAQGRERTIEAVHYALDNAAVILGYIPPEDFVRRWASGCPKIPPSIRGRIQVSRDAGRLGLRS